MKELIKDLSTMEPNKVREGILLFEEKLSHVPGIRKGDSCCPLKHTFVDGAYVREITMAKGLIITSKIHKKEHPYFIMKGDCSVLTEDKVVRLKAPYWGITKPGTKRLLYMHEETVWVTVHVTDSKDLKEIERQIIAPDFKNVITDKKK